MQPVLGFSMNHCSGWKYSMISCALRKIGNPVLLISFAIVSAVIPNLPMLQRFKLLKQSHGGDAHMTLKCPRGNTSYCHSHTSQQMVASERSRDTTSYPSARATFPTEWVPLNKSSRRIYTKARKYLKPLHALSQCHACSTTDLIPSATVEIPAKHIDRKHSVEPGSSDMEASSIITQHSPTSGASVLVPIPELNTSPIAPSDRSIRSIQSVER